MTLPKTNRREFIAGLAAASGGVSLFPSLPVLAEALPSSEIVPAHLGNRYGALGYKRIIIDYHYSEFNPEALKRADAAEIIQAVSDLGVDSLLLYSKDHWGNIYHKSAFSKRHHNVPQDLFGEVLTGVKRHGIKVVAYTTVCWDEDSARKHPDWLMLDAENHPIRLNDGNVYAKWSFLCLNSPYRAYFLRQMEELIGNYDFEALFLDIVIQHRALVCYNPFCLSKWKERYGSDLPRQLTDADYARYLDFNRETVDSLFKEVKDLGLHFGKQFKMTHNFGLTYKYDDYLASEFDTHGADFYLPSIRAKLFRARASGKEVELIGHRFNQLWDFTVKPLPLMQFEVATAIAHNCAMCYVDQPYLDGSLDPQVYAQIKSAFTVADELAEKVQGTIPYAEIGLLSSERSFEFDYSTYRDFSGAYAMLSQLHWPFDVITESDLTEQKLNRFGILVVPNVVHLSNEQVVSIKNYVQRGGKLLFCYQSATKNENAGPIEQPSFGFVKITGESENQASFIRPEWKLGNRYLRVSNVSMFQPSDSAKVVATITNPALRVTDTEWITHNVMPGEDTQSPAIVRCKWGKGEYVYFGFRLFAEYVGQAQPTLKNAFETGVRALYEPQISVQAPQCVEAVFNRTHDRIRIALINGITGKIMTGDMWGGEKATRGHVTIAEIVPVHDIVINVGNIAIVEARNLQGKKLEVGRKDLMTTIKLPTMKGYELVELVLKDGFPEQSSIV